MKKYLLGIDVGTTTVKAGLFDCESGLVGIRSQSYPMSAPAVGFNEQSAEAMWDAVVASVRAVCFDKKGFKPCEVAAVSLSVQGGTLIVTDADFKPLRPSIVWSDTRCAEEAKAFVAEFGEDYLYRTTGWATENGLNALQIRWLKEHEPETFKTARYFLSVPDYISAKLCGIPALDLADAGINQLADIRHGCYDQNILNYLGISEKQLGRIVPTGEVIGHLTEAAAEELGLDVDTVLVCGAHDQYAVAAGIGCLKAGDIMIGTGTSWVVTAFGKEWDFDSGFAQSKAAVGDLKGSLSDLSTGGICLEWLRNNIAVGPNGESFSFSDIDREADKIEPGSGHLFFYPYFSGAYYPLKSAKAKAAFVGLDLSHNRFAMARSVMEGVAFQILWMLEGFKNKFPMESIKLSGGAAKSRLWSGILADASGLPVSIPQTPELACVGAAMIAGVGIGAYPSYEKAFDSLSVPEKLLYPNPENREKYAELFEEYKQKAVNLAAMYNSDLEETLE